MIKFYRGSSESRTDEHINGIYFTTDTDEIFTGDKSYGKNADTSVTTEDIVVAGGPLAAEAADNWPWTKDGNKVIPAGTSVQSILEGLFLKPVDGTVSWGTISWNPTLSAPTATLQKSDKTDAGTTAEVGTSLIASVSLNSTVNSNTRSATCTASQGYFNTTDGTWNAGNKTVSINGNDPTGTVSAVYKWNGTAISDFASQNTTMTVKSGSNTFRVEQSGISVTTDALPSTTVYASTNTKKVLSNVSATLTDSASATNRSKNLTSSKEDTITGYYRYFIGECDALTEDTLTSDVVRSLINKKSGSMTTSQISYTADHNPGKGFIVACPATNTIDYIKDDAAVFEGGFTLKTMNVKDAGDGDVSYNVYYCNNTGSNKAVYKFFKFK